MNDEDVLYEQGMNAWRGIARVLERAPVAIKAAQAATARLGSLEQDIKDREQRIVALTTEEAGLGEVLQRRRDAISAEVAEHAQKCDDAKAKAQEARTKAEQRAKDAEARAKAAEDASRVRVEAATAAAEAAEKRLADARAALVKLGIDPDKVQAAA